MFWVSPSGQPYLVGCICWIQRGFPLNLFYIVGCIFGGSLFNIAGLQVLGFPLKPYLCCRLYFWGSPSIFFYIAGCICQIFGVSPSIPANLTLSPLVHAWHVDQLFDHLLDAEFLFSSSITIPNFYHFLSYQRLNHNSQFPKITPKTSQPPFSFL